MYGMIHEECGVFGMFSRDGQDPVSSAYYALYALHHRGQQGCGIAAWKNGKLACHRQDGLVSDVFNADILQDLGEKSPIAIGHCLYSSGAVKEPTCQPLIVNNLGGQMAVAVNSSLTNADQMRRELESNGAIFHTSTDAEVIAYTVVHELLQGDGIEKAVGRAMERLKGAYCVVLTTQDKLVAFRDPQGFHPLCIGKTGESYVAASETCALDAVGASFVRDVKPGQIAVMDENGLTMIDAITDQRTSLCVFEFIYTAHPDSVVDGTPVHIARQRAGAYLAKEHPVEADVVIGVPDSGIDAAIGYSMASGVHYGLGFVRNKYIGRTFIQPTQAKREDQVRIKLNPIAATVRGKRVVLIDDSIVRGTTSGYVVRLLREAGAKEIHMRISSPPFLYPCYYGTDIDSRDKLIANRHTKEEIAALIGVDSLEYLSLDAVKRLALETQIDICMACFDGDYPVKPEE